MTSRPPRAPRAPPPVSPLEAPADGDALVAALAARAPRLLHRIPPAARPAPGALDALVLHDVALVAYAAGGACALARGVDLAALRLLHPPAAAPRERERERERERPPAPAPAPVTAPCSAVAFRGRDAAVAAAFGGRVVVFEGWSKAARLRGHVYDAGYVVAEVEAPFAHVAGLSWSADGGRLAAVGNGVCVWDLSAELEGAKSSATSVDVEKVEMAVVARFVPGDLLEGCARVDVGAISPDGLLLAGAASEARLGWVCALPPRTGNESAATAPAFSPSSPPLHGVRGDGRPVVSTLVGGWSGFVAMQWKPRGGGGPALMTTDADGSLRIWVKVAGAKLAASKPTSSWMEEIARCPHAEDTPRAGAAFVHWGGGGGVADDESDYAATAAAHPFMAHGVAPKPSRALHWVVRVAAGDARAWRVRGLDDQPRAEFARLEPGSGQVASGAGGPLGGAAPFDELAGDDGNASGYGTGGEDGPPSAAHTSLADACVAATRALAPIPLTTSSSHRVSLVKSYATSNGERRLRSPEPPEPPATASVFVLLTRGGNAYLARYDLCPTSDTRAVCRARIGAGHSSAVETLAGVPTSFQSGAAADAGHHVTPWLLSRGVGGETLLWRADASSPTREPLVLSARLPGPHLASSFAPAGLVSSGPNDACFAVFGVDAVSGAIHLYRVPVEARQRDCSSVQRSAIARRVVSCRHGNNTGDSLRILVPIPLRSRRVPPPCLVLAIAGNGRACCWHVSRPKAESEARFEPVVMRFEGRRFGTVTAADAAVELGTGRHLVVVGSTDGCLRLYEVVDDGEDALGELDEVAEEGETNGSDGSCSDDYDDGEGAARFRELAFLGEKDGSEAAISRVSIMPGGERVAATRDDGSMVVWERASAGDNIWHVSLSQPEATSEGQSNSLLSCRTSGLSFSWDTAGELNLFVRRSGDGTVEMYRKPHSHQWERSVILPASANFSDLPIGPLIHLGLNVLVAGCGGGLFACGTTAGVDGVASNASDGGSYSPPRSVFVHLLSGGHAWQTLRALEELGTHVEKSSRKALSSSTYAAGRGMAPPAPPLTTLLSSRDAPPASKAGEDEGSTSDAGLSIAPSSAHPGVKRSLFEELMARSEAKFASEQIRPGVSFDGAEDSNDSNLTKLSKRLRIVALSGLSRLEQSVLSSLCQAASSVEAIMPSLDSCGARFALISATFLEVSRTLPVPSAAVANALHSSATDALSSHFLPVQEPSLISRSSQRGGSGRGYSSDTAAGVRTDTLWFKASRLGAGWWITSQPGAKALMERIARSEFNKTRDADRAALWYVCLNRVKPLAALYRAQQNLRMSEFLSRNFKDDNNRVAAGKNAYVLVSKHRLELAAAFFILAGDVYGALTLLRVRMKDEQLAVLLARVVDGGSHLEKVLTDIAASPKVESDPHKLSMVQWLLGRHFDALEAVCEAPLQGLHHAQQESVSELDSAMGANIPLSALALGHLVALTNRPPVRGTSAAVRALTEGRERAMHALMANGSPVAGLRIGVELLGVDCGQDGAGGSAREEGSSVSFAIALSRARRLSVLRHVSLTAALSLRQRAVASSRAVRSGVSRLGLLSLAEQDVRDLCVGSFGKFGAVRAACVASSSLGRSDEIDAALAVALAALRVFSGYSSDTDDTSARVATEQFERICYLACARCVSRSLCVLSPLHRPNGSLSELLELRYKMKAAVRVLANSSRRHLPAFELALDTMKRAVLVVSIAIAYVRGDWSGLLLVLRSCEEPPASLRLPPRSDGEEVCDDGYDSQDRLGDDRLSHRSTASSLAPEAISLEGLRHIASNPAILGISPRLGHRRRQRRAPSLAMVDRDGASAAVVAEEGTGGASTLSPSSTGPLDFIRANPVLNTALGCCAVSYMASHQASRAADLVARNKELQSGFASEKPTATLTCLNRLLEASESFEQVAADAIAGWIPLTRFGSSAKAEGCLEASTEETAGAFVDLWCALGCLPEYAPSLSEAATVAAAEVASAAAIRASEETKSATRRRERRRRKNSLASSSSEGAMRTGTAQSSDIFDTTSAESLFGAYPVRFSASAKGPWSGRGRHARLYDEGVSLFRALCISSSDPPAIVVATPKGIQEVVPSSYTAMPAGFRSHYFSRRAVRADDISGDAAGGGSWDVEEVESAPQEPPADDLPSSTVEDEFADHIDASFGEGPYVPLDMSTGGQDRDSSSSSKRSTFSIGGKDAVWRRQVQATALAAHPFRRRFASGGGDGVVRLWDYADPISLGALRGRHFGRVAGLKFSAYGNALVSVHASGHVVLWQDPESAMALSGRSRRPHKEATVISAFQHRNASDVVFLDERTSVAAVGDPTAPTAVGHGLRIFDTREPNVSIQPSWSARIHNGGEARCLALLEDRVRVVTGGVDGSLSVVDMRMSKTATASGMQANVAELPAHEDEVTCLALESPRGRALVSCCRNGDIKLWDARTLLQLDHIPAAHPPTRHYWSGDGIGGMVGSYGTTAASLTDRSLISCGGDGILKVWGPGYYTSDLRVL